MMHPAFKTVVIGAINFFPKIYNGFSDSYNKMDLGCNEKCGSDIGLS